MERASQSGSASNDQDSEPDVVMACCGDTPTLEILAAFSILCAHLRDCDVGGHVRLSGEG
jgi:phosphoketolase